jgi:outer membrane protein OmpA-like peptidoglycan-associated protein
MTAMLTLLRTVVAIVVVGCGAGTVRTEPIAARSQPLVETCTASWAFVPPSLLFTTGSDQVDSSGEVGLEVLDAAAERILSRGDICQVRVAGHRSDCAAEEADATLSHRRAQDVTDKLAARGVPRSRIELRDYGATQPIGESGECERGTLHSSRRVEVSVLRCTTQPNDSPLEICEPIPVAGGNVGRNET